MDESSPDAYHDPWLSHLALIIPCSISGDSATLRLFAALLLWIMVAKEFLDSDRVNFLVWRFVTPSFWTRPAMSRRGVLVFTLLEIESS